MHIFMDCKFILNVCAFNSCFGTFVHVLFIFVCENDSWIKSQQTVHLPASLQEVAYVVISFRNQMERLPNDLLLHVLRLKNTQSFLIANQPLNAICVFLIYWFYRQATITYFITQKRVTMEINVSVLSILLLQHCRVHTITMQELSICMSLKGQLILKTKITKILCSCNGILSALVWCELPRFLRYQL